MAQMLARRAEVATTSGIQCVLVGAPFAFDSLQYLTHEYKHLFWHLLQENMQKTVSMMLHSDAGCSD